MKRKRRPLWRTRASVGTVLPGRGTLPVYRNKYGLKKSEEFSVSEGHGYPLVYIIF
jgi:hypothetical protein